MEPSGTSPHLYRLSNAPPPSLPTPQTRPRRNADDREEGESDDGWSGQESNNETVGGRKHSSDRGVKRKRPVMVSYVHPSFALLFFFSIGHRLSVG